MGMSHPFPAQVCDRLTGKCLCFASWAGATCHRKLCPNECSGHGQCMTMKELARRSDALPLNDGFSGWNVTAPEAPARAPGSEWKNGSVVRYEGSASSTTWDESIGGGCLCDSSWTVGLGAGETQAPEFFGADCSLRRCPSQDEEQHQATVRRAAMEHAEELLAMRDVEREKIRKSKEDRFGYIQGGYLDGFGTSCR